jgi:hypothetical protein
MKTKIDYYPKILEKLKGLHKSYPDYEMSKHLATATADYDDIWGLSDRQIYDLLEKYEFDLANDLAPSSDVDKIVKDGLNLENLFRDEEDEF